MNDSHVSHLMPHLKDEDTGPEIEIIYDEFMKVTGSPYVTNMWRTLANSLPALAGTWQLFNQIFFKTNLPVPIKAMILFSISSANHCTYCSAFLEVTCRTVGVDEEALKAIVSDLDNLNPERIQMIIRFAQRCIRSAYSVSEDEFDELRNFGITDEEIMEIISLAAMGNYFDTIADALKLETDEIFLQALPGGPLVKRENR